MIFDTHAHYDDEKFDADREQVIEEVFGSGVGGVVDVGTTVETSVFAAELAGRWPGMYAAVGLHPEYLDTVQEGDLEKIRSLAARPKVVAIGEIGLDYYWNTVPKEVQATWFERQLELARELDLPVIVHSRDALGDTFDMIRAAAARGSRGVIHCFPGSPEQAREYVKWGFFLGIGGVATYPNSRVLREVLEVIPLEHLVLETDCPYLTPKPAGRGKRNTSLNLPHVIAAIAAIKGIPEETVEEATWNNAHRLYGLTQ